MIKNYQLTNLIHGDEKKNNSKLLYECFDKNTLERFVIKIIPNKIYNVKEKLIPEMFNDEKIIKYVEHFEDKYNNYLVMENKDCRDLYYELDNVNPKKIIFHMLKCIKLLHDKNIVHLDIKPENFLVLDTQESKLQLIDFEHSEDLNCKYVNYRKIFGTKEFLCPERYISLKADIYSLGITSHCVYTKYSEINNDDEIFLNFYKSCITKNPEIRPSVDELINHEFFRD